MVEDLAWIYRITDIIVLIIPAWMFYSRRLQPVWFIYVILHVQDNWIKFNGSAVFYNI